MNDKKYKVNTKERLERLADAGQKVLGARTPPPATPTKEGEGAQKKP